MRLGELLIQNNQLKPDALSFYTPNVGIKIGQHLVSNNHISSRTLAQSLAEHYTLEYVDTAVSPPDKSLFQPHMLSHYQAHHYMPYALRDGSFCVATSDPSPTLKALLEKHYGRPVTVLVTGDYDLAHFFRTVAATAVKRSASHTLRRKCPTLTADRVVMPHQLRGIAMFMLLCLASLVLFPVQGWQMMLLACNLFYFFSLYLKYLMLTDGKRQHHEQKTHLKILTQSAEDLSASELPIYTVLVPLFHEPEPVLRALIQHLSALDYPREKLDIKLILEEEDAETLAVLKQLTPPPYMHFVIAPHGLPRTKPRACNIALQSARGEYLVIYDAEDKPAPNQPKLAVASFKKLPHNIACLQAALNYYNREENLLTRLFSIEYSALFNLHLPALEHLGIPIPLGGTSNHLRADALRAVGGWDAFNVTEDADLGIRLAYFGYQTRVLPSLTLEEAPIHVRAWLKQRTRWIKGYIQTWLVYTRNPRELRQRLGHKAYYGFQFFIGAPALTFLLAPFFWFIFAASCSGFFPARLYPVTQFLCLTAFFGGILNSLLYAHSVLRLERWMGMKKAMLAYPFYWFLHSIAAACALIQLFRKPHYWAKTQHGVSKFSHIA